MGIAGLVMWLVLVLTTSSMIPYCTASGVMKNPDRNPLQSYPWADPVLGNGYSRLPE
jgi:hypothetical protein